MMRFVTLFYLCVILTEGSVRAQEIQAAAWQITQYDISAGVTPDRVLIVRAQLTARNVGLAPGSTITLRISPGVQIKGVTFDDTSATFNTQPEPKTNLQRVRVSLRRSVEPAGTATLTLDYVLPVQQNSNLAAISPGYGHFLPLSFWYPMVNTPFALRGGDTAPFRLTVKGQSHALSGGVEDAVPEGVRFSESLSAQPFFIVDDWDVESGAGEAQGITAHLLKGASGEERKQAEALIGLAGAARAYLGGVLGGAPGVPIKLVSVERASGFISTGTVFLGAGAFRRGKIDAATALSVSEAIARLWIGGLAPVHGEGSGVLREGLTRYLALLFLEKQFGSDAAESERVRERMAYATIVKRDAPLSLSTPLDDTYYNSMGNKGAMVWRLMERLMGRDIFLGVLRNTVQSAKSPNGLTLGNLRANLIERGGSGVKSVLDQELDQTTDLDLLVGIPQQRGTRWVSALRNLGSIEADVNVVATTDRGDRLTTRALIPARNFSEAIFTTTSKIVRVEVDPEKLYPQLDYSNDIAPRSNNTESGIADGARLLGKQDYSGAEAIARQILDVSPRMEEAEILLARALLAENKTDMAEHEFRFALNAPLPEAATIAWAKIGLGEIELKRGQAAGAAKLFTEAALADGEYASTLTARSERLRAEALAGIAPAPEPSAVAFINHFDQTVKGGRKLDLEGLIVPGELDRFVKGIVGSQPEQWQTRVLRTETLDAKRLAADVQISARQFGRDQSGTALLILVRTGGSWKLDDIQLFEVR